jgi:hypothetical protein
MKKHFLRVLAKLSFLGVIALVASSVQGQSLSNRFRVDIPFDFAVGSRTLPAGTYFIGRALDRSDDTVIQISRVDNSSNSMRLTSPVTMAAPIDKPTLVFHRYGDQYFLSQVWPAGAMTGRQVFKSSSEREIERNLAANPSASKMAKSQRDAEKVNIVGVLQ